MPPGKQLNSENTSPDPFTNNELRLEVFEQELKELLSLYPSVEQDRFLWHDVRRLGHELQELGEIQVTLYLSKPGTRSSEDGGLDAKAGDLESVIDHLESWVSPFTEPTIEVDDNEFNNPQEEILNLLKASVGLIRSQTTREQLKSVLQERRSSEESRKLLEEARTAYELDRYKSASQRRRKTVKDFEKDLSHSSKILENLTKHDQHSQSFPDPKGPSTDGKSPDHEVEQHYERMEHDLTNLVRESIVILVEFSERFEFNLRGGSAFNLPFQEELYQKAHEIHKKNPQIIPELESRLKAMSDKRMELKLTERRFIWKAITTKPLVYNAMLTRRKLQGMTRMAPRHVQYLMTMPARWSLMKMLETIKRPP